MANWLQKLLPSAPTATPRTNLPTRTNPTNIAPRPQLLSGKQALPHAAIIYAIAASILIAAAISLAIGGAWTSALLVLLPALCFLGFALHFIKHQ